MLNARVKEVDDRFGCDMNKEPSEPGVLILDRESADKRKTTDNHDQDRNHQQQQQQQPSQVQLRSLPIEDPSVNKMVSEDSVNDSFYFMHPTTYQQEILSDKQLLDSSTSMVPVHNDNNQSKDAQDQRTIEDDSILPHIINQTLDNRNLMGPTEDNLAKFSDKTTDKTNRGHPEEQMKFGKSRAKSSRKCVKLDAKSKLEKSRQSARECRARKKLRYQYLEDLVCNRERAVVKLREELSVFCEVSQRIDDGKITESDRQLIMQQVKDNNENE